MAGRDADIQCAVACPCFVTRHTVCGQTAGDPNSSPTYSAGLQHVIIVDYE